jgi:hypothetical protein
LATLPGIDSTARDSIQKKLTEEVSRIESLDAIGPFFSAIESIADNSFSDPTADLSKG